MNPSDSRKEQQSGGTSAKMAENREEVSLKIMMIKQITKNRKAHR